MSDKTKNHVLDFLNNFDKLVAESSVQAASTITISPNKGGSMFNKIINFYH